jgi:hypothetical protein
MRTRPTFGGGPTELHSSIFALPCKLPPNRPNGRKIDVMPAKSGLGGHDRASGTSSALRGPGMKPACAAFIRLMSRSLKCRSRKPPRSPFNRLGATVTLVPREEDLLIERGWMMC